METKPSDTTVDAQGVRDDGVAEALVLSQEHVARSRTAIATEAPNMDIHEATPVQVPGKMRPDGNPDEPITIVEYDQSWPGRFAIEKERIAAAMADVVTRIEPFGSTAVPGMAGKPVIDLLVGVPCLADALEKVPSLVSLGYENFGELFIPGRIYLRRRGAQQFNIAMTEEHGDFWRISLLIRDYLRANADEAAAYSQEKRAAFARGARLFSTYSQAKGPYLDGLRERAEKWRAK